MNRSSLARVAFLLAPMLASVACGGEHIAVGSVEPDALVRACTPLSAVTPLDVNTWFAAGDRPENFNQSAATGIGHIQSKTATPPDGSFGTWMGYAAASPYHGKRVRFSAVVWTKDVTSWGGLWMRVDPASSTAAPLAFDNMQDRPISGTTYAHRYEIELDVSAAAKGIGFGALMVGGGELWITDAKFEVVEPGPRPSDPTTWFKAGDRPQDYELGTDATTTVCSGRAAAHLASHAGAAGFGTLMDEISAHEYLGKRVRMTATVKAKGITGWAGLWMRVDDKDGNVLAFDNMQSRAITGTSAFTRYSVVLNVSDKALQIAYGALLAESGEAWVDDVTFEVVDSTVPTTGR